MGWPKLSDAVFSSSRPLPPFGWVSMMITMQCCSRRLSTTHPGCLLLAEYCLMQGILSIGIEWLLMCPIWEAKRKANLWLPQSFVFSVSISSLSSCWNSDPWNSAPFTYNASKIKESAYSISRSAFSLKQPVQKENICLLRRDNYYTIIAENPGNFLFSDNVCLKPKLETFWFIVLVFNIY